MLRTAGDTSHLILHPYYQPITHLPRIPPCHHKQDPELGKPRQPEGSDDEEALEDAAAAAALAAAAGPSRRGGRGGGSRAPLATATGRGHAHTMIARKVYLESEEEEEEEFVAPAGRGARRATRACQPVRYAELAASEDTSADEEEEQEGGRPLRQRRGKKRRADSDDEWEAAHAAEAEATPDRCPNTPLAAQPCTCSLAVLCVGGGRGVDGCGVRHVS